MKLALRVLHRSLLIVLVLGCASCAKGPLISNAGYLISQEQTGNAAKTWDDLQSMNVVMQEFDYSCGAAALATLIKYYFGENVTEADILVTIQQLLSAQEIAVIQENGLSFFELERLARFKGYQSASVKLELTALRKLSGPVMVYIAQQDYRHFVVFRGVFEERVFLADPSRGNVVLSIGDFLEQWKGETLIMGKNNVATLNNHKLSIHPQSGFRHELLTLKEAWKIR